MLKVSAAIIERNGKILICKRPSHKQQGGKWEFPGGKIEFNETPEACLKRELNEELGIDAEIGDYFCSTVPTTINDQIELIVFHVSYPEGDLILQEHDEVRWIDIREHNLYEFAPADIPVVHSLLAKMTN